MYWITVKNIFVETLLSKKHNFPYWSAKTSVSNSRVQGNMERLDILMEKNIVPIVPCLCKILKKTAPAVTIF